MGTRIKMLLVALFVCAIGYAQVPAPVIPAFNFLTKGKTSFTNKNLPQGKKIFFVFFDTECEHCQHAIQYIHQHLQGFQKAAIYLVTLESAAKTTGFLSRLGPGLLNQKKVTILQDVNNEFIQKFKPKKYPSIFLYSPQKKLLLYDDDEKKLAFFLEKITA